ncbi:MAG TPA: sigma-54 dependent transcriptional regulator [Puia sp.]|jgi:DNA-binding NtrC family response regulator|nr:sigma-54 dependent transcriptional regulator [Puia sp.]
MAAKILIVEDELVVAEDIRLTIEQAGYEFCGIAPSVNRALELVNQQNPCLVLVDIFLKGNLSGLDLAFELNKRDIPFVYLSANYDHEIMENAKRTQPYGFVLKPIRAKDLLIALDIAHDRWEQKLQLKFSAKASIDKKINHRTDNKYFFEANDKTIVQKNKAFEGIVGKTPQMQKIFDSIGLVAPFDTSVLILGESGTGKEGIANAIHNLSQRRDKEFVKVNCSSLPHNLIESELFGHEKGAFTGAIEKRIGKFERANGGTIFLDEIGDMPADMQVKLLRVLQEKEFERIGSNTTLKIDVRIIAATNRDLEMEIEEGRFRLDLFYRLHVFPINLPPLRERKEDIPLLTKHFIKIFSEKARKSISGISDTQMKKLMEYSWPGNIRELQNLLERTILLSKHNFIDEIWLPEVKQKYNHQELFSKIKTIDEMQRDHVLSVLKHCNERVSGSGGAAELLKLPPSTLTARMKKLGIQRKHSA